MSGHLAAQLLVIFPPLRGHIFQHSTISLDSLQLLQLSSQGIQRRLWIARFQVLYLFLQYSQLLRYDRSEQRQPRLQFSILLINPMILHFPLLYCVSLETPLITLQSRQMRQHRKGLQHLTQQRRSVEHIQKKTTG